MEMDAHHRRQEPAGIVEEEDPVALALAPYLDPHYGDRDRDRRRRPYPGHHYYRPPQPPISFQQPPRSHKRACIPASSKAIGGLKEVVLTTTTTDDDDCAICLKALAGQDQEVEDYDPAADAEMTTTPPPPPLRAMPCSHIFHQHCIFQWLRRNAVCPLCRHQLPTTDDDDEEKEEEEDDEEEERGMPDWLRVYLEAEVERTPRPTEIIR